MPFGVEKGRVAGHGALKNAIIGENSHSGKIILMAEKKWRIFCSFNKYSNDWDCKGY